MIRKAVICALVLLISTCALGSPGAGFNWRGEYAAGNWQGHMPSMAIGPDNKPYMSHFAVSYGLRHLLFSTYENGEWVSERVEPDAIYDHGGSSSLVIDEFGNAHISYYQGQPGHLAVKYAFKAHGSMEWEITEVDPVITSFYTDLALDEYNQPHIAYTHHTGHVFHNYRDLDGIWHREIVNLYVPEPIYASIALGANNEMFISFFYVVDVPEYEDAIVVHTGVRKGDHYEWDIELVKLFFAVNLAPGLSMTVDPDNAVHLVRYDPDDTALWYMHKVDGEWVTESIDVEGDVGKYCSIASDPGGNLYVAYNEIIEYTSGRSLGKLKFAYKASGADQWQFQVVDDDMAPEAEETNLAGVSLAVNHYGCPHIAYFDDHHPDESGARFLKYTRGTPDVPRPAFIAAAPGPNPDQAGAWECGSIIKVYWGDGYFFGAFDAYGTSRYGANVATGDVDGDGVDEIITGPGPGRSYGSLVRVFEADGTPVIGSGFFAYDTSGYGVNVAAGDVDGDGVDEIITGAGPGDLFGPHVRVFELDGSPVPGASFCAYGTSRFGVNVSAGDVDGDGRDEILTGAGPGVVFGPHVRGWNCDSGSHATAMPNLNYLAYGTSKYGVNVCVADLDGDGYDEIITGAGPGGMFGPHVRGWNFDNDLVRAMPGISFMAFENACYGVQVAAGDIDGNGISELVAGVGADPNSQVPASLHIYPSSQQGLGSPLQLVPFQTTYGVKSAIGVTGGEPSVP